MERVPANGPVARKKEDKTERVKGLDRRRRKKKREDSKVESNDSPEILDGGETSDIPGLPSGEATGTTRDKSRSGRTRVTAQAQNSYKRTLHLRNRFQCAQKTAENFPGPSPISNMTVLRCLQRANIHAHRPLLRV